MMALATDATAAAAPTAPPQRQSCDRCHKQKLRCTRKNNGSGGICDRCWRKRAQCVYSFSQRKGRPSLYRLTNESSTSDTRTESLPTSTAKVNSGTGASIDAGAHTHAPAHGHVPKHSDLAGLMTRPMDMSWLETLTWDDVQLDVDRSHSSHAGAVVTSVDTFEGGGSAQECSGPPSPTQPSCPPSPHYPYAPAHGQSGRGLFERQNGSTKSNTDGTTGGVGKMNMSLEEDMSDPSLFITQLSQLSARLSSLRYSSYTLAEAAESSSRSLLNGRQNPLIDAAAFESVAAWLAHGHDSANMSTHPSVSTPAESQCHSTNPAPETKPRGGHDILRDVFSASHHLLEILRCLQGSNVVEPFNSFTAASASLSSAATTSQTNGCFGLTKGHGSATSSSGSQQHRNNTTQIIRHLVIACEALLLEIYVAVLMALQHDAYPGASRNMMPLGDVRLVLVVQLCSYLIERQQKAVHVFLAPQSPFCPPLASGPFPQKPDLFGLHQPVLPGPVLDTVDRDLLSVLRGQVQHRLARLQQTLICI